MTEKLPLPLPELTFTAFEAAEGSITGETASVKLPCCGLTIAHAYQGELTEVGRAAGRASVREWLGRRYITHSCGLPAAELVPPLGTGMQRYKCHKEVDAKPMTLGVYNRLRGWTIPPNEDTEAPGYLVEYLDGGGPNHPDYAHYISWSPKAVFEAGYTALP